MSIEGSFGKITTCAHGLIHISLGAFTLHLSKAQFIELIENGQKLCDLLKLENVNSQLINLH